MPGPTHGLLVAVALAIPVSFCIGAVLSARRSFPVAAAYGAFCAAVVLAGVVAIAPDASGRAPSTWTFLSFDAVTCTMAMLVTFIGVIVSRYARKYLEGDPGRSRFASSLFMTLTAISLLVLSDNLLLTAAAWTATSLALHRLLVFYPERPQAVLAARKKFLLSRLADLLIVAAIVMLASTVGTLHIGALDAWATARETLPWEVDLAVVLLVLAVVLKSAQIPFHGWLIQVMEAPTPVSALLHAGVVNIGGFVLVRLAPLVGRVPMAQTLLVAMGTFTAVVAALVATTRVSVKVSLAWSTCAQMGFMLVECGLGAWQLALLHIVAHSLYKASSFLRSGSVVAVWRTRNLAPVRRDPASLARVAVMTAISAAVTAAGLAIARRLGVTLTPAAVVVTTIGLTASLLPMFVRASDFGLRRLFSTALAGVALTAFFAGVHGATEFVWASCRSTPSPVAAWIIAGAGFATLLLTQTMLTCRPHGLLARELHPLLFGGLYLDEIFTRVSLRIWPWRATSRRPVVALGATLEAR